MSGFAGIVIADGGTPDAKLVERMAERLAFRGPDAKQVWMRPGAGFCFTLLCTGPSPQAGSQPVSLDGRIWLLGDVRLDGREELLRKLEQQGEKASADATNEELILRAWRRWGEKSFEVLIGDFAFALWDAEVKQLWCVRDMLGARPFFLCACRSAARFQQHARCGARCSGCIREARSYTLSAISFSSRGAPMRTAPHFTTFAGCLQATSSIIRMETLSCNATHRSPSKNRLYLKRREDYIESSAAFLSKRFVTDCHRAQREFS